MGALGGVEYLMFESYCYNFFGMKLWISVISFQYFPIYSFGKISRISHCSSSMGYWVLVIHNGTVINITESCN